MRRLAALGRNENNDQTGWGRGWKNVASKNRDAIRIGGFQLLLLIDGSDTADRIDVSIAELNLLVHVISWTAYERFFRSEIFVETELVKDAFAALLNRSAKHTVSERSTADGISGSGPRKLNAAMGYVSAEIVDRLRQWVDVQADNV